MTYHPWAVSPRPLVFAHRGGSRLAPENTLAAFDRAVSEGADGLELDVHLSADGEVVVCHDPRVERTTNGTGAISEMTALELGEVDAGFHFRDTKGGFPFRGRGLGIPTLRDVVAQHPGRRLIVEIKDEDPRLVRATLDVLRAAGALDRTCLGSFRAPVLQLVRSLEPAVATGAGVDEVRRALYLSWLGLFPRRPPYHVLQLPERRGRLRVVSPRFVKGARRAAVPVFVWVVDEAADVRRLLSWGVHGIITDRPDVAVPIVQAWGATTTSRPALDSRPGVV